MFSKIKGLWVLALGTLAIQFFACSGMNDLHDVYLREGERIYLGRLSMAELKSGKDRVLLRYVNKDPKVEKLVIYWSSGRDSVILDVPREGLNDTVSVHIENLQEDNYNFELYTANSDFTHKSMKYELNGDVYGDRFQNSLQNRSTTGKTFYTSLNHLVIDWARSPQNSVGAELSYVNLAGSTVTKRIALNESATELLDVGGEINIRTLFLPRNDAIDTFYTDYAALDPVAIEGFALDKSLFRRWNPPGIPYRGPWDAWRIELAWDHTLVNGFANENHDFTFEIGQLARLSQFVLHARRETDLIFNHAHMRRFQIWGSATADVSEDFSGWTLLGTFESIKPSGNPLGVVTAADIEYAHVNGEKYAFASGLPPVRYIRVVAQNTWGNQPGIQFMEFSLLGVVQD